ncbi:hypothetical protein ACFLRI_03800 [Bacteroidota bacterium]
MPHYDYLQNQIDELGKFLGKLLALLLQIDRDKEETGIILQVETNLQNEGGLDLEKLLNQSVEEIIEVIGTKDTPPFTNLDLLAKIMCQLSYWDKARQHMLRLKSKQLLEYLLVHDPVYRLDREVLLDELNKKI